MNYFVPQESNIRWNYSASQNFMSIHGPDVVCDQHSIDYFMDSIDSDPLSILPSM